MKKLSAILLCAALLVSCLAGCGTPSAEATPTPETTATPTETPTETPEESPIVEEPAEPAIDPTVYLDAAYAAYEPDTVVMTVNGEQVHWNEYFYWLYSAIAQLETYTNYYAGHSVFEDMSAMSIMDSTVSNGDYAKRYADEATTWYHGVHSGMVDAGIELTDENKTALADQFQSDVTNYGAGDEQAFVDYLASIYLGKDVYDYVNEFYCLYGNAFDEMYGELGASLEDAEVVEYAEGNGYLAAKHILLSTTNAETGEALTDEAKAELYTRMEGILAELKAAGSGQAVEAKFDELMNANSEDPGLAYYPDGYCFTADEMLAEFSDATMALESYGVSEIVETTAGYHIILRLPLDPSMKAEMSEDGTSEFNLRYVVASSMFGANTNSWADGAKVVFEPEFENLDVAALFA